MIIQLDTTSSTPIYVQLRNQIVLGIGQGALKIGEGLPTVRQLASDIGVNTMTVNKAYTILKNEGFIEIDRRHGAKVRPKPAKDGAFTEKVEEELALLAAESALKGMEKGDFLAICEAAFKRLSIAPLQEVAE